MPIVDNVIFSHGELLKKGCHLFIEMSYEMEITYVAQSLKFTPIFTDFTAVKNMQIF